MGRKHGRRRCREQVIRPGEEAYVLGRVESESRRERFRPDEARITVPDDGVLVLSEQGEASLEAEFGGSAKLRLVAGSVSTVVGAWLLLP